VKALGLPSLITPKRGSLSPCSWHTERISEAMPESMESGVTQSILWTHWMMNGEIAYCRPAKNSATTSASHSGASRAHRTAVATAKSSANSSARVRPE